MTKIATDCFANVEQCYDAKQETLATYGTDTGETTIAVVRRPRDTGIDDICDEHRSELGMPEQALMDFYELCAKYRENDAVPNPSDRAYTELRLDERYEQYLESDADARSAVTELATRAVDGEQITLVCFEEPGQKCHRYALQDAIEKEMSRLRSDTSFDIVDTVTR